MTRWLALILLISASPAAAAQNCFASETLRERLAQKHDEHVIWEGLTKKGAIAQVFGSLDRQSWTVVITSTNGMSCVLEWGTDFNVVDPDRSEEG